MKYWLATLTFIILLFACSQPEKKARFELPAKAEINSVVRALFEQDSIHFKQRRQDFPTCPISMHLFKTDIIYGKNWHKFTQHNTPFFDLQKDSVYLQFQDSALTSFAIDTIGIGDYQFMNESQIESHKNDTFFMHARISIPQFSADRQTAYLQFEFVCMGLCGSGHECYLRKENGHWKIVKKKMIWVS